MHRLITLLWNSEERRLRAFWRLLAAIPTLIVVSLLVALVTVFTIPNRAETLLSITGSLLLTLVITVLWVGINGLLLDRRYLADYGFHLSRRWWLDLGFGLALGAALMAGVFLLELALGWISIVDTFRKAHPDQSFGQNLLTPLVIFLCVGIYEELMLRGYLLPNIAEGLNRPPFGPRGAILVAWLVTSVLFGFAHMLNPNTTLISTINLILAGVFLGLGYVLTGNLAIPIGVHITWNLFQGSVFGFPVSGQDFTQTTVFMIEQAGPPLWTGGAFGPEAGLIGLVAMLVGCGGIALWARLMDMDGRVALRESLAEYRPRPPLFPKKDDDEDA
jgi:membrane protease YdiL (CAAX protease family)